MRRKSRLVAMMFVFSGLCAYIGYTSGAPTYWSPCNTDVTNKYAFTCKASGSLGSWVDCVDQTQVPYCRNNGQNVCDPQAQFIKCRYRFWSDAACATSTGAMDNQVWACKP